MTQVKVTKRALGPDGRVAGSYDDNPMLNSIVYEVEFPDGEVKEYAANVIAENILSQVDEEGFSLMMMEAIIDFKKDESVAIPKDDKYLIKPRGQQRLRKMTKEWKLLIKWKDQFGKVDSSKRFKGITPCQSCGVHKGKRYI